MPRSAHSDSITGKALIDRMLWICGHRTPINMRLFGEPPTVTTLIHEVQVEKEILKIDAFNVGEIDRNMRTGDELEAFFHFQDLQYRFLCRYRGGSGVRFHLVSLPKRIDSLQQRDTFRVTPLHVSQLDVRLSHEDWPGPIRVEARNLSIGGLQICPLGHPEGWEPEMHLGINVYFPEQDVHLETGGTICYVLPHNDDREPPLIGIRFDPLKTWQETFLSRLVMQWQREWLKREREID